MKKIYNSARFLAIQTRFEGEEHLRVNVLLTVGFWINVCFLVFVLFFG